MISHTPKTEVHQRIAVEDVDVTQYYPLINKWVRSYERSYGQVITDNYDDFVSVGLIGILKAKKAYDPSRGTFVTIAFHKVFTEIQTLYKKLMTQERFRDQHTIDEDSEDLAQKKVHELPGAVVDYDTIGNFMSGRNKMFYAGLCKGLHRAKICAMCDIPYSEFDEVKQEVKEEALEILSIITGDK